MNKLKMESVNLTEQNIDKIAELFPQVVTEVADPSGAMGEDGKPLLKKAIDFEKLKLVLSAGTGDYVVADDERERYEFTWVGKRQAMIDAATPIRKTLRPCPEDSKDWATTENLYIEGDNLEVLKLLQESYLGKVKMIYIDPPYNTGKDFIYKDNFAQSREEYEEELDMFDEEGNRLFQNTETNGRFHSDWCSMIYPRLQLARNLLTDDGVIFISIDDNEVRNLKNICDEVFCEDNCCGIISRVMKSGGAKGRFFSPNVEYILVYSRNINLIECFREGISDDIKNKLYTSIEENGEKKGERYRPFGLYQSSLDARPNQRYYIECPDGTFVIPPGETKPNVCKDGEIVLPKSTDGCWRWSKERYLEEKSKGNIAYKKSDGILIDSDGNPAKWNIYTKIWLSDREEDGMVPVNLITKWENRIGTKELSLINIPFDFSKPSELIKYLISIIGTTSNAIILDFFSGSATTAHAVMQLNAEDGGNRKFIMVQLPEVCDPNSEAAKAGYKTICEIGKERIRRAGDKICVAQENSEENLQGELVDLFKIERDEKIIKPKDDNIKKVINIGQERLSKLEKSLDAGFRVFKLDTTNMKDVYYAAGELSQADLFDAVSNIKDDRSDIDLLYGCLLDWGVYEGLQLPHTTETIGGYRVHTVDDKRTDFIDLIACFDEKISEETVRTIAARKPLRAVFRDSSFTDSADKINVAEIFKALSPDTTVKVI